MDQVFYFFTRRSGWSRCSKVAPATTGLPLGAVEKKTGRPSPPEASDRLEVEEVELNLDNHTCTALASSTVAKVNDENSNPGGEGGEIQNDSILKSTLRSLIRKPIFANSAVRSPILRHRAALWTLLSHSG